MFVHYTKYVINALNWYTLAVNLSDGILASKQNNVKWYFAWTDSYLNVILIADIEMISKRLEGMEYSAIHPWLNLIHFWNINLH